MTDPRLEDHVVGLELQLVELVEQRERALVQGENADASAISTDIDAVQSELTEAAEVVAADDPAPPPVVDALRVEDAIV